MDDVLDRLLELLAAWVRAGGHQPETNTRLTTAMLRQHNALLNIALRAELLQLLVLLGKQRMWKQDSSGQLDDEAALAAAWLQMP